METNSLTQQKTVLQEEVDKLKTSLEDKRRELDQLNSKISLEKRIAEVNQDFEKAKSHIGKVYRDTADNSLLLIKNITLLNTEKFEVEYIFVKAPNVIIKRTKRANTGALIDVVRYAFEALNVEEVADQNAIIDAATTTCNNILTELNQWKQ